MTDPHTVLGARRRRRLPESVQEKRFEEEELHDLDTVSFPRR